VHECHKNLPFLAFGFYNLKLKHQDFEQMILFFRDRMRLPGKATFSKGELSMILAIYGDRVKRGEWRDYAIDCLPDMAVFSVFRSSLEKPAYAIAKIPARSFLKPSQYAVYENGKTLKQGSSLSTVLEVFNEAP
jgi:hypothetical protein